MIEPGPAPQSRKTGDESFHQGQRSLPFDLLDFWRWSGSDLVSNATRGRLAEYIVAKALGVQTSGVRTEWDAYDLEMADGITIEVKSAAYIQSWHQDKPSRVGFGIKPTIAWDAATNAWEDQTRRQADVYVLALLAHQDKATIDPLNVAQWEFWAVPTRFLDEELGPQARIALSRVRELQGAPVGFDQLKDAVSRNVG